MRTDILGVGFDPVTTDEAVDFALERMAARSGGYICTPNPEIVMAARRDPALAVAVSGADLTLCDGVGVLWASRKLGHPLPERVAGYDFLLALLGAMEGRVYILGGRPGIADAAARTVARRFPGVTVCGTGDGYFDDEDAVLAALRQAEPDLTMVCLGSPKQELFMAAHREPACGLMIGLGGSADVLAGTARRAPESWRRRGLEWLYRLLREPRRILRQTALIRFAAAVLVRAAGFGA